MSSDEPEFFEAAPAAAPAKEPLTRVEKNALERERLLASLASGATSQLNERVAWILSRFADTRDSDVALQLRYWEEFEPDTYAEFRLNERAYFKLTKLTSMARARAKIQNTFRLFQASEQVRKMRGRLSEEEREKRALETPPAPILTVYADESGKTGSHLIVGSVWFLNPRDTGVLWNRIERWRRSSGFTDELHFSELTSRTLPFFVAFVNVVIDAAPLISFKSISVSRTGLKHTDTAFARLYSELLSRGIAHEHSTGRAELPRRLLLFKDAEETGSDRVLVSQLEAELLQRSASSFGGQLSIDGLEAVDSRSQPLLQLADLYVSSINRVLARSPSSTNNHKDSFADFLLGRVASMSGQSIDDVLASDGAGDVHVHMRL